MKTKMKKLLSALLALAMASGLFAVLPFTASAAESTVNWDEFYIITEPQKHTIQRGETITLSVEVNVPDGVVVEYQWRHGTSGSAPLIENATTPVLRVDSNSSHYPSFALMMSRVAQSNYLCSITARELDDDGTVLSSKTLRSNPAAVTVEDNSAWAKFLSLTIDPFVFAFIFTAWSIVMSWGLGIITAPIVFPGALIMFYYLILTGSPYYYRP